MRHSLYALLFFVSCAAPSTQEPPPTKESTPPKRAPVSMTSESLPAPKVSKAWDTFILDYSWRESGGAGRGELRLCSDGWLEVNDAGASAVSVWLSAAEVDALRALLQESDWERAQKRKPDDESPARYYTLGLSGPSGAYKIEGLVLGRPPETKPVAAMLEALRQRALSTKPPARRKFSIEILNEDTGGTVPVIMSTTVSSDGAISQGFGLGLSGTTLDGAQLFPLYEAVAALEGEALPAKRPEEALSSHIVSATTVTISGDLKMNLVREAQGLNAVVPIEPPLARFIREVMFIAERMSLSVLASSMQLSLSCSQYGVAISTSTFSVEGASKKLSASTAQGAAIERTLDKFSLSALVKVLSSPQMKALQRERPKSGPDFPGVEKCELSFLLGGDKVAVTYSSADQYSQASREAISALRSTLNWMQSQ